jgi:DNA-directed RNA polymerase subunit RPC12/RpoP
MSPPPTEDGAEDGPRCHNCGAPLSRRETGMLSMSVGTRCPECGART